jgi:hypothetical protein
VVTNCDHLVGLKYSKTLPIAFTEHGAIMAANVINSARAVEMSVFVVRAFVRFREALSISKELGQILSKLEQKVGKHDEAIKKIIVTIRDMMEGKEKVKTRKIGFNRDKNNRLISSRE